MTSNNFISQRDAMDLLDRQDISFVDGSWYLPAQNRNQKEEYAFARIPGAIFFDIDVIADIDTKLPHMLPHPDIFTEVVSILGLSNEKTIIVYDGPGLFSAPRVWWTLKTMGATDVRILEGGFDSWKKEGLPIEKGKPQLTKQAVFKTQFTSAKVASINAIEANIKTSEAIVLDARPNARFTGKAPEPREGMRGGHIPGSKSLPVTELVKNGKLIEKNKLEEKFRNLGVGKNTPVITTCGSGVTAAIISLALSEIGHENYKLYDGSWAQWGLPDGPEVETG